MQKSAGTERVDNLIGGMEKEKISEKPWPDHGSGHYLPCQLPDTMPIAVWGIKG